MKDQTNNEPAAELFDRALATIDPENCTTHDQLRSMFVLIEVIFAHPLEKVKVYGLWRR